MYYFIVNPNSRSGRGRSIWNEIHQQLMLRKIDFQYCLTRYSGTDSASCCIYPINNLFKEIEMEDKILY